MNSITEAGFALLVLIHWQFGNDQGRFHPPQQARRKYLQWTALDDRGEEMRGCKRDATREISFTLSNVQHVVRERFVLIGLQNYILTSFVD